MWNAERGPLGWWRRTFGGRAPEEAVTAVVRPAPRQWIDEPGLLSQLGGDRELLGELSRLFVQERDRRMPLLRAALSAGDAVEVGRAAHGIKSGLTNFCAPDAVGLAAGIEAAGREGTLEGLEAQVEALHVCMEEMERQLAALGSAA